MYLLVALNMNMNAAAAVSRDVENPVNPARRCEKCIFLHLTVSH